MGGVPLGRKGALRFRFPKGELNLYYGRVEQKLLKEAKAKLVGEPCISGKTGWRLDTLADGRLAPPTLIRVSSRQATTWSRAFKEADALELQGRQNLSTPFFTVARCASLGQGCN